MIIKVTVNDIGKKFYPVDNSYSQDLTTGMRPTVNKGAALAGMHGVNPVQVEIVMPIKMTLPNIFDKPELRDMVLVRYEERLFVVLNYFTVEIEERPELFFPISSFI